MVLVGYVVHLIVKKATVVTMMIVVLMQKDTSVKYQLHLKHVDAETKQIATLLLARFAMLNISASLVQLLLNVEQHRSMVPDMYVVMVNA